MSPSVLLAFSLSLLNRLGFIPAEFSKLWIKTDGGAFVTDEKQLAREAANHLADLVHMQNKLFKNEPFNNLRILMSRDSYRTGRSRYENIIEKYMNITVPNDLVSAFIESLWGELPSAEFDREQDVRYDNYMTVSSNFLNAFWETLSSRGFELPKKRMIESGRVKFGPSRESLKSFLANR